MWVYVGWLTISFIPPNEMVVLVWNPSNQMVITCTRYRQNDNLEIGWKILADRNWFKIFFELMAHWYKSQPLAILHRTMLMLNRIAFERDLSPGITLRSFTLR